MLVDNQFVTCCRWSRYACERDDLWIECNVAMRQREHAPRKLERLALLGDFAVAVGSLDQSEHSQPTLWPELAPASQIRRRSVDDAAQSIERGIAGLLGTRAAQGQPRFR